MARDLPLSGSIAIRNAQRSVRVDVAKLQEFSSRALDRILAFPPKSGAVLRRLPQVTVVLVSDRRIAALHRQFMNVPGATDVITFQEGDVFISVETAKRNARRFRTSLLDEIRLYIAHGLLHLHGFEDKSPDKARVMSAMQERIVRELTR